ncbi:MAG: hypothetical protein OIN84_09630, partial [Candidatus Methanoperedens sp.]|nr:hypothetical protein [Candidatus Methanoperedens sp.]
LCVSIMDIIPAHRSEPLLPIHSRDTTMGSGWESSTANQSALPWRSKFGFAPPTSVKWIAPGFRQG